MTRVVRLTLAYDGTEFHGWAKQREQRTVEGRRELVKKEGGEVRI